MASLKTFFSPALVKRLAGEIQRVYPAFARDAFVRKGTRGLEELELLDRGRHIARALAAHLPSHYPDALDVLLASLGPEHASDELLGAGMEPFFYYPHTLFVAEHGLDDFDRSLPAQRELTKRFSAESSIRPFIQRDPERTFTFLRECAHDRNPHVRRLASEGSRLRLPWSMRVAWLDANPERVLALLELLKDDPSTLVRRSVANNLNDLGKVHPELLIRTCNTWLEDASPERRALVEHALRSAIKRGEIRAMHLLGYGTKPSVSLESVAFDPPKVAIGGRVRMEFVLRSDAARTQDLLVDVAVHFVQVRGTSAKVFKVKRVALDPRSTVTLSATFSLAIHTTRVPRAGRHEVDVLVNGVRYPAGAFTVQTS